jgi:hypothetical protein
MNHSPENQRDFDYSHKNQKEKNYSHERSIPEEIENKRSLLEAVVCRSCLNREIPESLGSKIHHCERSILEAFGNMCYWSKETHESKSYLNRKILGEIVKGWANKKGNRDIHSIHHTAKSRVLVDIPADTLLLGHILRCYLLPNCILRNRHGAWGHSRLIVKQ